MFSVLGKNLPLKILSVFLAVLLWVVISRGRGGETIEISLGIPLELHNFPKNMEIVEGNVERVDVRFSGPRRTVSRLSQMGLTIPIDLSGAAEGETTFEIFASDIQVPQRVTVTRVSPSSINVVLEKVGKKEVPVALRMEGNPPEGYYLGRPKVVPPNVVIRGPASFISAIDHLDTPPIPVHGSTVTLKGETGVLLPQGPVHILDRSTMKYEIPVIRTDPVPAPTP